MVHAGGVLGSTPLVSSVCSCRYQQAITELTAFPSPNALEMRVGDFALTGDAQDSQV